MSSSQTSLAVAVIGAGPSGLVACKTLAEHGVAYVAYEAGERVGGQWVLGNSSGTSAAYRSLRVNTHKGMSRYSDFELPAELPNYPTHDQMADWFGGYARHFDLVPHIRLNSRVRTVTPRSSENGGYVVELADGSSAEHSALIVAVGNLWDPRWPTLAGEFNGPVLHAKDYLDPTEPVDCRGKRVLVMGLGNTGCELAVELCADGLASRVLLSARSGQNIMPKVVAPMPHPSDPLTGLFAWLPPGLRDAAFRTIFPRVLAKMRSALPAPESLGLPPAPASPFEKRMVMNDHIHDRLASGRIVAKPGVSALRGDQVEFSDGSSERVDVLIAATGYRFSLPFLSDEPLGEAPEELSLWRGLMHPRRHDLFIVGVMKAMCSIWPRSEQQMKLIAPLLSGAYALPSQREIDRNSYRVLDVPFGNCQFYSHDLRKELERGAKRAAARR